MRTIEKEKKSKKIIVVILIILAVIITALATFILRNKVKNNNEDYSSLKLIINYTDVTNYLKAGVFRDENETIYLGKDDIANFYDEFIYYDKKYNQIITTSNDQIMVINIDNNEKEINGKKEKMKNNVIIKNDKFFIPLTDLEDIYNIKANYYKKTNTIVIDSVNNKLVEAESKKKNNVKYKCSLFSQTAETIEKGDKLTIVQLKEEQENIIPDDWVKVRTQNGSLGYVKKNSIGEEIVVRQEKENTTNTEKISLVWDYYSEYATAPNRTGTTIEGINVISPSFFYLEKHGQGNVEENIGTSGRSYIKWAHSNGYKVWPIISNNSMQETTSEIMEDYKMRQKLINHILEYVDAYDLDGINIDFENMKEEYKDLFSRFIIELTPRMREKGKVVSIDVTEPDGSPEWSLCFDRNTLGKVVDYMMFMAYDQTSQYSEKPGTTAGYNWVDININKFINREEVPKEKLILAIPFYTRLWEEKNGEVTSNVVSMKNTDSVIPKDAKKEWDDTLKQNYVEYEKDGATYKIWIEDEESIKEKLNLAKKYNLQGVSFWLKDFEKESIWKTIKQYIE